MDKMETSAGDDGASRPSNEEPFVVQMTMPSGVTTELLSGTTVLGRSEAHLGITDRRVSRKHAEVTVSKETNTVTLMSSGVNPSFIHRRGENRPEKVRKGELKMLKNGDRVSLVEDGLFFDFAITEDEDVEPTPAEDEFDQDATQPNVDFFGEMGGDYTSPNSVQSPIRAGMKRAPGGPIVDSHARRNKKVKTLNWGDNASLSQDWDSQNSENSTEMPGLRGVKIDARELGDLRTIGRGSCGEVFETTWRGTRVAVKKVFRGILENDALKEFKAETHILRRLRHPNVILFMGTCKYGKEMCIVTEYMSRGSLYNLLKDETCELGWDLIAIGAAQGMNYLHTFDPPIIHRDLKSHNLLVDQNYNVKVTDFGLARAMNPNDTANTFCGTMPWTAPEIFNGSGYTTKADVYSYGIVLWELITRAEPYEEMSKPQIIVGVSKENLRPEIPPACPPEFAKLMQYTIRAGLVVVKANSDNHGRDCWEQDPECRPRFSEILKRLEAMQPPLPISAAPSINITISPHSMTERFKAVTAVPVTMLHSWEIEASELAFLEEVGQGASANVFKGKYRGQEVAIKVLKQSVNPEEFKKEFEIMSEIRSPMVVFFYGAVTRPSLSIVTEFLSRGSLYDVMRAPDVPFQWDLAVKLAIEAAKAVNALHCWKPSIVHRDLKSPNLLVDENYNVKVADFGLARFKTTKNESSLAKLRGTYIYAAPEAYNGEVYTTKSDVYSFGVILWEIVMRVLTGSYVRPFSEHKNLQFDFQILIKTAKKGLRPTIPPTCPRRWRELIMQCWHAEPEKRPDIEQILAVLAELKANPELSKLSEASAEDNPSPANGSSSPHS